MVELKMSDMVKEFKEKEVRVIKRNLKPPKHPPYMDEGTEIFDPVTATAPAGPVELPWGGRPSVPGGDVIKALMRDIGPSGYDIHISDSSYTAYNIFDVLIYLKRDLTNFKPYISEVFDCDDFAQVLQGNINAALPGIAFGTIWYGGAGWGHAVNIFYCHIFKRIFLIEPQNDKIYYFNKSSWNPWMVII